MHVQDQRAGGRWQTLDVDEGRGQPEAALLLASKIKSAGVGWSCREVGGSASLLAGLSPGTHRRVGYP